MICFLLGVLVFASAADAAAPPNDDFANVQDLGMTLPASASGDNAGATTQAGEPSAFGPFGSVWFKWTAGSTGPVHVDVCDSADPPPFFGVYTGTDLPNLQLVIATRLWGAEDCAESFEATAGTTYYISVDRFPAGGALTLNLREATPPPNDDFSNAQAVSSALPALFVGSTVDATSEPGEPIHADWNTPTKSAWYRWIAPSTGEVNFESGCSGPLYSGVPISIYTGTSLSNLVLVGGTSCYQTLNVAAGTTYWIAANSDGDGPFAFRIENSSSGYFSSANDDFAAARVITPGLPRSASGSTIYATAEDHEPDPVDGVPAGFSQWFRWTATTSGPVSIDTCLSDFDTLLAVYQGSTLETLNRVASNDDAGECDTPSTNPFGARAVINAVAGTEYRIAVDAFDDSDWGDFFLNFQAAGPQIEPPGSTAGVPLTGKRAAALKKCKKQRRASVRKKCLRKARRLPA